MYKAIISCCQYKGNIFQLLHCVSQKATQKSLNSVRQNLLSAVNAGELVDWDQIQIFCLCRECLL